MQVRLKEYEGALREYKKENSKFFEAKERYKATIASLEREVQVRRMPAECDLLRVHGWLQRVVNGSGGCGCTS